MDYDDFCGRKWFTRSVCFGTHLNWECIAFVSQNWSKTWFILFLLFVFANFASISGLSMYFKDIIISFLIPITRFWFRSVYLYCLWTKNVQPIFMPRHGNNEVDQLAFMMIVPVVLIVLPFHFTWYHQLL